MLETEGPSEKRELVSPGWRLPPSFRVWLSGVVWLVGGLGTSPHLLPPHPPALCPLCPCGYDRSSPHPKGDPNSYLFCRQSYIYSAGACQEVSVPQVHKPAFKCPEPPSSKACERLLEGPFQRKPPSWWNRHLCNQGPCPCQKYAATAIA